MSSLHKLSTDYTPPTDREQRRVPLPITNLPVTAISEDMDPTAEIRTLIEQLQQTARDARGQIRAVEKEKENLAVQLEDSLAQIDRLRANESDMRSQFVEVTTHIRERELARADADRHQVAAIEAKKQVDSVVKERNDAQRQREEATRLRDEALRKSDTFRRAADEAAAKIAEAQKQVVAIRHARDAAHALNLELTDKLSRAEDEIAELGYVQEAAQKTAKQADAELSEYRRQLETVTSDRDATAKQVEMLTQELDTQRSRLMEFVEQKTEASPSDGEPASALAAVRAQVASLTQERDVARLRAQEQAKELEEIGLQFRTLRDDAQKLSGDELAGAREKLASLEAQTRDSRHEAANLKQQVQALTDRLGALQSSSDEAAAMSATAQANFDGVSKERDAALTSLNAAQKQIERIIADRDIAKERSAEAAIAMDSQLTELRARLRALEEIEETAKQSAEAARETNARFEAQRHESIDLATQLGTAQREIRELSASLAEARLQVKFANAAAKAARGGAPKMRELAEVMLSQPAADHPPALIPPAPAVEEPITDKQIKSALGAMRQCFQSFTKSPADLSLLNELFCHVHAFSERTRVSGLTAVHRLCAAFSDFARGLYENPAQVNPSTLRTLNQTIEFLASLMKEKNLAQLKDPAKALIYAVDDDLDNCECIRMAMETTMMRTSYSQEPGIALGELAGSRYDLIFLDVNLPGMDGFELCAHIRQLAIHEKTPIVFLTGLATLENRVQSTLSGGNDFIGKPFNLHELSVKALTHILRAEIQPQV